MDEVVDAVARAVDLAVVAAAGATTPQSVVLKVVSQRRADEFSWW